MSLFVHVPWTEITKYEIVGNKFVVNKAIILRGQPFV